MTDAFEEDLYATENANSILWPRKTSLSLHEARAVLQDGGTVPHILSNELAYILAVCV